MSDNVNLTEVLPSTNIRKDVDEKIGDVKKIKNLTEVRRNNDEELLESETAVKVQRIDG